MKMPRTPEELAMMIAKRDGITYKDALTAVRDAAAAMELACVILPIPKDASTTNRAKRNASVRPANLVFMP